MVRIGPSPASRDVTPRANQLATPRPTAGSRRDRIRSVPPAIPATASPEPQRPPLSANDAIEQLYTAMHRREKRLRRADQASVCVGHQSLPAGYSSQDAAKRSRVASRLASTAAAHQRQAIADTDEARHLGSSQQSQAQPPDLHLERRYDLVVSVASDLLETRGDCSNDIQHDMSILQAAMAVPNVTAAISTPNQLQYVPSNREELLRSLRANSASAGRSSSTVSNDGPMSLLRLDHRNIHSSRPSSCQQRRRLRHHFTPRQSLAAAESSLPLGAIQRILGGRSDNSASYDCRVRNTLRAASAAGAPRSAALSGTQADCVSKMSQHVLYR